MDQGEVVVLSAIWWAWDHPLIRKANNAALLESCLRATERAFAENIRKGRKPDSWKGFESHPSLPRDPRNIRRVFQGELNLTTEFLLGIASILDVRLDELYPKDTREWLAKSTVYLSEFFRGQALTNERATFCHAREYASFRLGQLAGGCRLGTTCELEACLESLEPGRRAAVIAVTKSIGPGLRMIGSGRPRESHG